ncbi:MAG: YchJ family protein [Granulosicoccus sp.]
MSDCPCGSGTSLEKCCQPIINGDAKAEHAESLIRARYTAHTLGEMDFIFATHHPSTRSEIDRSATERWARESTWLGLDIIATDKLDDTGTAKIEFRARYRDVARRRHTHHERAVFEKYHGQWYFRDAEVPEIDQFKRSAPKQGRNEPCACGSGRKYKKCCAVTDPK